MDTEFDLIVIGGGSAGLTAAGFAVQLGATVALVERWRMGGDCTWTGCVPSKTLLKAAKVAHLMRTAERHGLKPVELRADLGRVMGHVREVISSVYEGESPEALRADGIVPVAGAARFLDPHSVVAGEEVLRARKILICTGAYPLIPEIEGLKEIDYLTYETVWDMETLPGRLVVVGGGPIGCELSQAFRRLGSKVTLVGRAERLLPRDDPAAARVLQAAFEGEGIELKLKARVERVRRDAGGIRMTVSGEEIAGDALLFATGRRPRVDGLDLERAGVAFSGKGIQVDDNLRTSAGHIYAAGDCAGGYQFTHYAGWQAFAAVRNALLPGSSRGVTDRVPWTTFTDPEVAHVGLAEDRARKEVGSGVMACEWPMEKVDRARAEGDTAGFVKIVHTADGSLLGVTIVAERAGEMIHEWVLALDRGLKVGDVAGVIHVYPTYSTASMQAAAAIRVAQFLESKTGRLAMGLARLLR